MYMTTCIGIWQIRCPEITSNVLRRRGVAILTAHVARRIIARPAFSRRLYVIVMSVYALKMRPSNLMLGIVSEHSSRHRNGNHF